MDSLIYLYDNFLIYYPNIFFPVLFLIGTIGLVLLKKAIVLLNKSILEFNKRVGKRNYSFDLPIQRNFKSILLLAINLFILIDKVLTYFQFRIEKIIKEIRKEIFIEE